MERIFGFLRRAAADPAGAWRTLRNRLFPLPILMRDAEAYQSVTSWTFGDLPRRPLAEIFPGIEDAEVEVHKAFRRESHTSLSAGELLAIAAVVRHHAPRRILEIGTFNGTTTLNLAANAPPDARVTTIDLPPDWEASRDLAIEVESSMKNMTPREKVGENYRGTPFEERIDQVFGDSAQLDWSTLGGPFDLVFIDGCHTYEYVRSDTENALAQLAPGGVLLWHDYGSVEGVSRAVDEFRDRLEPRVLVGGRLAIARV